MRFMLYEMSDIILSFSKHCHCKCLMEIERWNTGDESELFVQAYSALVSLNVSVTSCSSPWTL